MRQFSVRNERGIALVVAILALVVIGAIVAGTFFISTVEQRTSFNTVQTTQAFEAAEAGLQQATANWTTVWNSMPSGQTEGPYTTSNFGGGSSYSYKLTRLNDQLFLLKSTGTRQGAQQTLASLIRLMTINVNVNGAVTSGGSVRRPEHHSGHLERRVLPVRIRHGGHPVERHDLDQRAAEHLRQPCVRPARCHGDHIDLPNAIRPAQTGGNPDLRRRQRQRQLRDVPHDPAVFDWLSGHL